MTAKTLACSCVPSKMTATCLSFNVETILLVCASRRNGMKSATRDVASTAYWGAKNSESSWMVESGLFVEVRLLKDRLCVHIARASYLFVLGRGHLQSCWQLICAAGVLVRAPLGLLCVFLQPVKVLLWLTWTFFRSSGQKCFPCSCQRWFSRSRSFFNLNGRLTSLEDRHLIHRSHKPMEPSHRFLRCCCHRWSKFDDPRAAIPYPYGGSIPQYDRLTRKDLDYWTQSPVWKLFSCCLSRFRQQRWGPWYGKELLFKTQLTVTSRTDILNKANEVFKHFLKNLLMHDRACTRRQLGHHCRCQVLALRNRRASDKAFCSLA